MTSKNTVAEVWITIGKEERSHILSAKVFVPSSSHLEDITTTVQGGREMR